MINLILFLNKYFFLKFLKNIIIFKIIKSFFNQFNKLIYATFLINLHSCNLIFVISYSKLICVILFLVSIIN